ncbi:enoyl-CoA hydratase/isomerase family protein [Streptomyces profundus]|uniref:enoyl-CoA hydratase/isomerase family protein n=1 Tax=Streptomyces profundus TaxID=2867410 RepID=UPI001D16BE8C|nr:enoyl-CoA hydratase-related protein [Streptomyces sp. MA3_2.13]UED83961.1 enoyl-CoA hydratase/isomerase family protein [Streptomyces sp. MA3_2.13]
MTVHLEVADRVGTLTLDRPPLNALDIALQDRLRALATEIAGRDDIGAVVLRGNERAFAAGADVKEMRAMDQAAMIARARDLQDAFTAVARLPQPVVAAVTGYALGGGLELALTADVRFAAEDAKLGQPEILLGLIPGAGGTQRLPRLIGPSRAKDLIFTGRQVSADEALALGLVDRVLPADQVFAEAHAWAARLARGPATALRAAKEAVDGGLDAGVETGLTIERTWFASLFATDDRAEGIRSFVEEGPGKARFGGRG